jgi:hypothetical protein
LSGVIDTAIVAAAPIEVIVSPNIVQASPDYSGQRAKCLPSSRSFWLRRRRGVTPVVPGCEGPIVVKKPASAKKWH